jgi:hypothetical protein
MFGFRNVLAVSMFLFGTTFMWMTAAFAGRTPPPRGSAWTVVGVVALVAVAGFSLASWGVWKDLAWWQAAAAASAVVGLAAVVPYVLGLRQAGIGFADLGIGINLAMHLVGSAAVLAIVLVPLARDWVTHRL